MYLTYVLSLSDIASLREHAQYIILESIYHANTHTHNAIAATE